MRLKYKEFRDQKKLSDWVKKNESKIDYSIIYGCEDDGTPVYIVEYFFLRKVY
jgi:hypothetical protein